MDPVLLGQIVTLVAVPILTWLLHKFVPPGGAPVAPVQTPALPAPVPTLPAPAAPTHPLLSMVEAVIAQVVRDALARGMQPTVTTTATATVPN